MSPHPIVGLVATLTVADPAGCDRAAVTEMIGQVAAGAWLAGRVRSRPAQWRSATRRCWSPRVGGPLGKRRPSRREARSVRRCPSRAVDALASGAVAAGQVDAIARAAAPVGARHPRRARRGSTGAGRRGGVVVGGVVRTSRPRARPPARRRRRAAPGRTGPQGPVPAPVDRPRDRPVPHPRRARPGSRRPPVRDARRRRRRREGQARGRDPDVRPAPRRRVRRPWPPVPARRGHRPAEISVLIDHETYLGHLHDHSDLRDSRRQPTHPGRRSGGSPATPTSSPSSSTPTAPSSTTDEPDESPQPPNAEHSDRCTEHAATPAAPSGSPTARSTTSSNGSSNAAQPTSTTSSRSAHTHHHALHEGGWHLTLRPDRTITLRRPDGTIAYDGTTIDVAPASTTAA